MWELKFRYFKISKIFTINYKCKNLRILQNNKSLVITNQVYSIVTNTKAPKLKFKSGVVTCALLLTASIIHLTNLLNLNSLLTALLKICKKIEYASWLASCTKNTFKNHFADLLFIQHFFMWMNNLCLMFKKYLLNLIFFKLLAILIILKSWATPSICLIF